MKKKEDKLTRKVEEKIVGTRKIPLRGRKFEGFVIKKVGDRIKIEFERVKFIRKYERYAKSKSKIHAKLPEDLKAVINVGDYIQIQECRPLSKILHHVVIKKIRGGNEKLSQ